MELIERFKKEHPDKRLIALIQVGSHLFNLNSENSDLDYKGIYMPSLKELTNGESRRREISYNTNKSNSKNTKNDIDCTFISVTKFLDLLMKGEFNSLESLFAPEDKIVYQTKIFQDIRAIRDRLVIIKPYTFLGFIKREYRRYGVGVNILKEINEISNFLKNHEDKKIKDIYDFLALKLDHGITYIGNKREVRYIVIGKRKFLETVKISYVLKELKYIKDNYVVSHRKDEDGIDTKGLYHAQRLIFELRSLLLTRKLEIPFPKEQEDYLRSIRKKEIPLQTVKDNIEQSLEDLELLLKNKPKNDYYFIENYKFNLIASYRIKLIIEKYS